MQTPGAAVALDGGRTVDRSRVYPTTLGTVRDVSFTARVLPPDRRRRLRQQSYGLKPSSAEFNKHRSEWTWPG